MNFLEIVTICASYEVNLEIYTRFEKPIIILRKYDDDIVTEYTITVEEVSREVLEYICNKMCLEIEKYKS